MAFLRGLGKAPTFLVPIINPPFADNSPHLISDIRNINHAFPFPLALGPAKASPALFRYLRKAGETPQRGTSPEGALLENGSA